MKKQTKLSLFLLIIISAFTISLLFQSCDQPVKYTSQGANTQTLDEEDTLDDATYTISNAHFEGSKSNAEGRIAPTSTGENIYIATDANDFQSALTLAETQPISLIIIASPTAIVGNFTTKKPKSKDLTIQGGTIQGSISREYPTNQNQAVDSADNWYQYKFNFNHISFIGSGTNGINLNSCYASIRDCNFNGKDTAINLVFCMNAQIVNNQVINSKKGGICLNVGTDKWSWAGNSTSASNHPFIEGNRVFNMQGAEFGLALIGLSGPWVQNHISEGKSPKYHVIINDLNSTTAWNYNINNIHLESVATGAGFLIKSRQCIVNIVSPYPQYAMTLIDAQSYAGVVQINVENLCWQPSGTKYASTGNVRYRFKDLYNSQRVDTTTMWVNAKFPNVLVQENLTANGLVTKQYISGRKI